ncbi:MAG: UPF0158 family protein [Polyangiaceae bacterium]
MPSVSLQKALDALDVPSHEFVAYFEPASGDVVVISEEDLEILESGEIPNGTPDWMKDSLAQLRGLDLEALIPLPTKFDIHEWELMKRFSMALAEDLQREELLDAIHGAGAFRMFRHVLDEFGLGDAWFAYRQQAFKEIILAWASRNKLEVVDDTD